MQTNNDFLSTAKQFVAPEPSVNFAIVESSDALVPEGIRFLFWGVATDLMNDMKGARIITLFCSRQNR